MSFYQRLSRFCNVRIDKSTLKEAFTTDGAKFAAKSWLAFGGSHLLLSTDPIRSTLINNVFDKSEENFRMAYSALQATILATIGWKFAHLTPVQRGPILVDRYLRQSGWKMTSASLRVFGVLAISEAFLTAIKNPIGMNSYFETIEPKDPREQQRKWQPYGLQRITRHSLFFGYSLYAIGMMMMARRKACDLILWGGVPLFSILGALHQDYRVKKRNDLNWSKNYYKETSFLPFGAYLRGEQAGTRITTEIPPSAYSSAFVMIGAIFFFLN